MWSSSSVGVGLRNLECGAANSHTREIIVMPDLDFDNTIAIVRLCVNGNRADIIEDALFDHKTAGDVRAMIGTMIESESPSRPAAASAAADGSPNPVQRDGLTAAVRQRMAAMYPPRSQ
jgi:hypothetical protein